MIRRLLTACTFILSIANLFSQVNISHNCRADIAEISKAADINNGELPDEIRARYAINSINNIQYLSVLAKVDGSFDGEQLDDFGVLKGAETLDIISLKIPVQHLNQIYDVTGIITLQVAGKIKPTLDKVRFDTKVDSVHAGLGGLSQGYTGQDVLIGITDWGFDYSSPMFYDTLLQETRIVAAWDQFKNSGPAPGGFDYGTEYDTAEELLDAQADTANIYSFATHGSHVAGIAGGSGAGTDFKGVAPSAGYLFTTFLVDEASVLDAWEWMYQKSITQNKRLIINMSWGLYYMGANDGTSLLSQALDSYSELGVLFVTSNGNNGNVNFHVAKVFDNDSLKTRINFYNSATLASLWGQSIHGWGTPGIPFSAAIQVINSSNDVIAESELYSTATTASYIDSYLLVGVNNDSIIYNLSMDAAYPENDRPQMRLRVKKPPIAYKIALKVTSESGIVHFWNVTELSNDVGNWGMPFSTLGTGFVNGDSNSGVGAPACSHSAISVAAYSPNYLNSNGLLLGGPLASFSSKGPLINGVLKPEISAPGVNIASSISSYTDNNFTQLTSVTFNDREYPFAKFSGTSMSSPVVAGVAALMLEANPTLTPEQVKQIIIDTAREDIHTGEIPTTGSVSWGFGKINALAAMQSVLGVSGIYDFEQELPWNIYPNPASETINISGLSGDVSVIQIMDLQRKICHEYKEETALSLKGFAAGIYFLRIIRNQKVEQRRFIVE